MIEYSTEELAALKKEHAANATDEQFRLWIAECRNRNLAPVRDIIMQIRTSEDYDPEVRAKVKKKKSVYVVTIGAKRKIANSTGLYAGQLPTRWIYLDKENRPTVESEIPLPDPTNPMLPLEPWAVRTSVLRKGFEAPLTVVSRFGAYCQTYKRDGEVQLTAMWSASGRSAEMIEKCSESAALTRAFPDELAGLYIREELEKDDVAESLPVASEVIVEAPKAPVVPTVNHTPAVATDAPRPNEQPRIEDVVLNRRATPAPDPKPLVTEIVSETVQKMDKPEKPAKVSKKDKAAAALEQDHAAMIAQIDQKIEENHNRNPDDRPVTPEENTANVARLRALMESGVHKANLKAYVLKEANRGTTQEILFSQWNAIFTKLDAAGGKDAINALIAPQEDVF
jgi:hypothetical protein